ncbi:MAG: YciI family protein [Labilithrix sp.]
MSEFLFLYRGGERPAGTPEQMQQTMQKWISWMNELQAKGNLKERGVPLEPSGKIVRGKDKQVVDGPFAEAKDVVGGYSIIEAKDLAHAVELSMGCPILAIGGDVEVRPALKM